MKTAGIIAEYNPFHKGHEYQFKRIREDFGADWIIAAISGDFVQRGEPAVFDKYTRTSMALSCGADLVVELPVSFATGSAEDFASCGVSLFDHLGIIDLLCFGSEAGDLESLNKIAELLANEPENYKLALKASLKKGLSFPAARENALKETLSLPDTSPLSTPNNILGVEYLKALKKRKSSIKPVTIKRFGQGYHDTEIPEGQSFASASFLRKYLRDHLETFSENELLDSGLASQIPVPALKALSQENALKGPVFPEDLTLPLQYRLLQAKACQEDLCQYADMSPELADRLSPFILSPTDFSRRIEQLKTKQYTYTRISRALLHLILGITKEEVSSQKQSDYVSYVRILGFRQSAAPLLNILKKQSCLPLITKTANSKKILSPQKELWFQKDLAASHFYQALAFQKGRTMKNEYTKSVIILP